MKHTKRKVIGIITMLSFLVAALLTVLDLTCFDRSFYPKEYAKYNNAEIIGISEEQLMEATDVLLDYIQGKREDMVVKATIFGEEREVFNERETAHMVDVRALYQNAMLVRNLLAGVFVLGVVVLLVLRQKRALIDLAEGIVNACAVFLAIFLAIGFFAYVDFNRFWTCFHQIFFQNDLWLLNPNTDIMIMMVPEGFFYDLVFKIAINFLVIAMLVFLGAQFILKQRKLILKEDKA